MRILFVLCVLAYTSSLYAQVAPKPISRPQLEYYLSRAISISNLCDFCKTSDGLYPGAAADISEIVDHNELQANPTDSRLAAFQKDRAAGLLFERYNDVLRLIKNVKAKMVIDAVSQYGGGVGWPPYHMDWKAFINRCTHTVNDIKALDSEIVVQASLIEYVDDAELDAIGNIPGWVFAEFGLPAQTRKFDKERIAFLDYKSNPSHFWYGSAVVPDISRVETKMLYYFLAVNYINMGCESLEFCQVELVNNNSIEPTHWNEVFQRLRKYAAHRSNIRFLLITGHTTGMKDAENRLLFDFHSSPIRPSENGYSYNSNGGGCYIDAEQCWGGGGKLYNISMGGVTPSGWECDALPGLVFLDNWVSDIPNAGKPAGSGCNQYHWDEISWFAMQDKAYRDEWLWYASDRVRYLDSNIYFALPVKRGISVNDTGLYSVDYLANDPSPTRPELLPSPATIDNKWNGLVDRKRLQLAAGFGQETTIKEIIARQGIKPVYSPVVSIAPNPVQDFLAITVKASRYISLRLFYIVTNAMGQKIKEGYLPDAPVNKIDLSQLSTSIYFINVYDEDRNVILASRILKE